LRYLTDPREWTYAGAWAATGSGYGAEQRAAIAEHLWRMEHGLAAADQLAAVRRAGALGRLTAKASPA